jgi:hypothetical protein
VTDPPGHLPVLAEGDVYVHAHRNGAIFVGYADGRSLVAPLPEALAIATGCHDAGRHVVVAWDDVPIATAVVDAIRARGVPVVEFSASRAPHRWDDGTDALMESAAHGTDHLLDDLLARGADLQRADDSGSTALHHAAANGNLHAVGALVASGADLERRNGLGFTPRMVAVACREMAAAARLEELGADPGEGFDADIGFGPAHFGVRAVWAFPPLATSLLVVALWPPSVVAAVGVVAFAALYLRFVPPRAFWAGGAPRRLQGTRLAVRSLLGRTRTIDLREVTVAGLGGSTSTTASMSARWLLLAHPSGHPVDRRALERLLVPAAELDALAERIDRVVVVALDGPRSAEVIRPVGNLLSALGIDVSASLRSQLHRARELP